MADKDCPHFAFSPSKVVDYCSIKPHEENLDGSYRLVACTSDNFETCSFFKEYKLLEKEIERN
jgi:hypothetical protein